MHSNPEGEKTQKNVSSAIALPGKTIRKRKGIPVRNGLVKLSCILQSFALARKGGGAALMGTWDVGELALVAWL